MRSLSNLYSSDANYRVHVNDGEYLDQRKWLEHVHEKTWKLKCQAHIKSLKLNKEGGRKSSTIIAGCTSPVSEWIFQHEAGVVEIRVRIQGGPPALVPDSVLGFGTDLEGLEETVPSLVTETELSHWRKWQQHTYSTGECAITFSTVHLANISVSASLFSIYSFSIFTLFCSLSLSLSFSLSLSLSLFPFSLSFPLFISSKSVNIFVFFYNNSHIPKQNSFSISFFSTFSKFSLFCLKNI